MSSVGFSGILYRFADPKFGSADSILSGEGAIHLSDRWHPAGTFRCLYTAKSPETALKETLASNRYDLLTDYKSLPRLLVGIAVELHKLLDLTDGQIRSRLRFSLSDIVTHDWKYENQLEDSESRTQALGRTAYQYGYEGLIAPSAAHNSHGINLILFRDNLLTPEKLSMA